MIYELMSEASKLLCIERLTETFETGVAHYMYPRADVVQSHE